jgi:hypothetical protein
MSFVSLRLLTLLLAPCLLGGCVTSDAPTRRNAPTVLLTSAQKHYLEQKKITLEQELLALESSTEIQRLMAGYSSLEDATVSLAVQQTYSVTRYYQVKSMIARLEYLLQ